MDVGNFSASPWQSKQQPRKGHGKGQGNPHKDKICDGCGKKGHIRANCWHEPARSGHKGGAKGGKEGKKGKGKGKTKGKGKGKKGGTNVVEEEWEAEAEADEEEELTTVDVGDVCGLCERPEVDADGWLRLLLDSGCARTVFPQDADYGVSSPSKHPRVLLKTASGEVMESGDDYRVYGTDEQEAAVRLNGVLAPVRKPLVSTGAVTGKDNDVWFSEDYGYVIRTGTQLHREFRKMAKRLLGKYAWRDAMPVYKERGVYNFYVKSKKVASMERPKTKDVCPQETATEQQPSGDSGTTGTESQNKSGSQRSVNRRQGRSP